MKKACHVLGIDVGGTKIAGGVVRFPKGEIVAHRIIPTKPARGSDKVLDDLFALANELVALTKARIQGAGVGICELVSPDGKIQSAATLKWTSQQIHKKLARFAPITIEADVRAAALAEALFGTGRKYRNFLFVTIGTGISCCLVVDGQPYTGTRGATGTMASGAVTQRCEKCSHIQTQTLEDVASGRALAGEPSGHTGGYEAYRKAGEALGSTLALLIDVLDPGAVVVGGGLGLAGGPYWDGLVASTRTHIWSQVSRRIPIQRAKTGRNAGTVGAAAAAWLRR